MNTQLTCLALAAVCSFVASADDCRPGASCKPGWTLDKDTCACVLDKESSPRTECSPLTCRKSCPYGMVKDENGCSICKCKDKPEKPECGPQCRKYCRYGFALDENGCETCSCNPKPRKKTHCGAQCRKYCPYGFVLGENGCPTCTCNPEPDGKPKCRPQCKKYCPFGFVLNKKGCSKCKCRSAPKKVTKLSKDCGMLCRNFCPFGRHMDENGCPTCTCKRRLPETTTNKKECKAVCRNHCVFGRINDKDGCPTCKCKANPNKSKDTSQSGVDFVDVATAISEKRQESGDSTGSKASSQSDIDFEDFSVATSQKQPDAAPIVRTHSVCSPVRCRKYCPNGWMKDANGCEICSCKPFGKQEKSCANVNLCRNRCRYGRVTDREGCVTCRCRLRPSSSIRDQSTSQSGIDFKDFSTATSVRRSNPLIDGKEQSTSQGGVDFEDFSTATSVSRIKDVSKDHCSPVRCRKYCPNGWMKDSKGCEICSCKPFGRQEAVPSCENVPLCRNVCPYGRVTGHDGCPTCRCLRSPGGDGKTTSGVRRVGVVSSNVRHSRPNAGPAPRSNTGSVCSPVRCRKHCPNGWMKDNNGCDICSCKPFRNMEACADENLCRNRCRYGRVTNSDGCPTCRCLPNPANRQRTSEGINNVQFANATSERKKELCASVNLCRNRCRYGRVSDSDGCLTCKCKPRPSREEKHQDTSENSVDYVHSVTATSERRQRPNLKAATGSATKLSCSPVRCRKHCPNGWMKDDNGCEICSCKPFGNEQSCANINLCRNRCRYGRHMDSNGCQTCRCKRRPDSNSNTRPRRPDSNSNTRPRRPTSSRISSYNRTRRPTSPHNTNDNDTRRGNNPQTSNSRLTRRPPKAQGSRYISGPTYRTSCRRPVCRNNCPFGRKYMNGCPTCSCKRPDKQPVRTRG